MKKTEEYKSLDYLKDDIELQKEFIKELLKEYFIDNNTQASLSALKPLILMNNTVDGFAKKCKMQRTYFYKLFKNEIIPNFSTIITIIKALGFNIDFDLKVA